MKTILSLISVMTFLAGAFAQSSGTVTYSQKIKLDLHASGMDSVMLKMLPKEHVSTMTLCFNADASLYQAEKVKKDGGNMDQEQNGMQITMKMGGEDDQTYRDIKNNKLIRHVDFMGRTFLVESDSIKPDWKMTGEQKVILGFPCQGATRQSKDKMIKAWFTSSIPVSTGPATSGNLPGLILEEDDNNGQIHFIATKVDLVPVDAAKLAKPRDGKKMTEKEFEKMTDEKMKEMGAEDGGNGQHIIIRTN